MALTTIPAEPILLGSGELYLGTVENPETADDATIEAALVNVGAIDSGASLQYKPTIKDVYSANRGLIMSFITQEKVTFKCGVMTWKIDNLEKVAPTTITTDTITGKKTIKIGGKGSLPVNYLRFIHKKKDGGELIVNILKAINTNGFAFSFDNEKPNVTDYEFKALACSDGTLVEIIETFPQA